MRFFFKGGGAERDTGQGARGEGFVLRPFPFFPPPHRLRCISVAGGLMMPNDA